MSVHRFCKLQECGPERDDEDSRHDQKEDREDELDAQLACGFLRLVPARYSQVARMRPQGRPEAGAETVGIGKSCSEFLQFRRASARSQ